MNDRANIPNGSLTEGGSSFRRRKPFPRCVIPMAGSLGMAAAWLINRNNSGLKTPRILAHSIQAQMAHPQHRGSLRSSQRREER